MKIIPATPLKPEMEFEIVKFHADVNKMDNDQAKRVLKELFTFHMNYRHMMEILVRHQWGIEIPPNVQ